MDHDRARRGAASAGAPVLAVDPDWDFAGQAILRFMTWPKSQRRQEQATVTWAAQALAFRQAWPGEILDGGMKLAAVLVAEKLGVTPAEVLSMPFARELPVLLAPVVDAEADKIAERVRAELFEPAGGYQRVAEAPGADLLHAEFRSAVERGAMEAGILLGLIAALHLNHRGQTASLNRAIAILLEMDKRGEVKIRKETSLKQAWTQWRSVAPLWAAVCLDHGDTRFNGLPDLAKIAGLFVSPARRRRVLSWAQWLREFAVTHKPPNTTTTHILKSEAVQIIAPVEPEPAPVGPIGAELLEGARVSRAWMK